MKFLFLLSILILSAKSFSCGQFDGKYKKSCSANTKSSPELVGALEVHEGILTIQSSGCSSLLINDPNYNDWPAPIYLKGTETRDLYVDYKGRASISPESISGSYKIVEDGTSTFDKAKTNVKFSIEKISSRELRLNYKTMVSYWIAVHLKYEADCILQKL